MTGAAPLVTTPPAVPLRIEDLQVRYPTRRDPSLADVTVAVAAGERVGVAGRTGAGKSTLTLAAAGFIPRVVRATMGGTVLIGDADTKTAPADRLLGRVGIVFATPANQLSASKLTVREELAFGLENLGVPRAEMDARIDAVLDRLAIAHLADREPFALSGGEQQRVAIASIIAMGTDVLVLDEPTAQLDPAGTASVADLLDGLARSGTAILCAEHAPEVLGQMDRCLVLDLGRPIALDRPGQALLAAGDAVGLRPPTLVRLAATRRSARRPGVRRGRDRGSPASRRRSAGDAGGARARHRVVRRRPTRRDRPARGTRASLSERRRGRARGLAHGRGRRGGRDRRPERIREDHPGQAPRRAAAPGRGPRPARRRRHCRADGRRAGGHRRIRVPEPRRATLRAIGGARGRVRSAQPGRPPTEIPGLVERSLAAVGLLEVRATNPYDLDLSRRKLVALAGVLAMDPAVLVLDEPTTGQDADGIERVERVVHAYREAGRTVIAITHDMEFAAANFTRIVVMRLGEVVLDGPPAAVFQASNADLLATTGLTLPPVARIGALLGLDPAPLDLRSLVEALAVRG